MITKVYAHILDEDRRVNAQKFETAFYDTDLRDVHPTQTNENMNINTLIEQLKESPELVETLAKLLNKK